MLLAARLEHPKIVPIIEMGQAGDDLWIATEFVDGAEESKTMQSAMESLRALADEVAGCYLVDVGTDNTANLTVNVWPLTRFARKRTMKSSGHSFRNSPC